MHHRQPTQSEASNPATQFKSRQEKMTRKPMNNNQLPQNGRSLVGQQCFYVFTALGLPHISEFTLFYENLP
jgi:hypothetical protein